MKAHLFSILFILVLQSCDPSQNVDPNENLTYAFLEYDLDCCSKLILTEKPVIFLQSNKKGQYSLKYVFKKDSFFTDTIIYELNEDINLEPKYFVNGEKKAIDEFRFVSWKTFNIDEEFKVYKYAKNPFTIDGCVTHFWTPKLGIILIRTVTWRKFQKLRTNNDSINRKIDLLTELIFQDTEFYQGCSEEFELISKEDLKKYYDWQLKQLKIQTR